MPAKLLFGGAGQLSLDKGEKLSHEADGASDRVKYSNPWMKTSEAKDTVL
jgi:hypothetical protein